MEKVIIVSADGHATPLVPDIARYLEKEYRLLVDDLIRENVAYVNGRATPARPPRLTVPMFDERGLVRSGGEYGASNAKLRLEQMDAEGIAGEVVHGGTQVGSLPFYSSSNGPRPPEVRMAGARAYHRWLADFMVEADGRLFGVAEPGPCLDMDDTVRELRWVADHGFVSVGPPGVTGDHSLPALYDPYFEPFWSACEELGLVISAHAGWGGEQSPPADWVTPYMMGDGETTGGKDFERINAMMQERNSPIRLGLMQPRRPMWQLMAGGVFDRHPGLRLALTEIRADWVPDTLAHLETRFAEVHPPCEKTPREYYVDHCFIIPSSPHRSEVKMRGAIGVAQFGFGQDFPHWESTWPNTLDWLRDAFRDTSEADLRAIVGENAISFYNLPEQKLAEVASRIGPKVDDILGNHHVSDELLQHFHRRAGYLRDADPVYTDELDVTLDLDLAGAAAARR